MLTRLTDAVVYEIIAFDPNALGSNIGEEVTDNRWEDCTLINMSTHEASKAAVERTQWRLTVCEKCGLPVIVARALSRVKISSNLWMKTIFSLYETAGISPLQQPCLPIHVKSSCWIHFKCSLFLKLYQHWLFFYSESKYLSYFLKTACAQNFQTPKIKFNKNCFVIINWKKYKQINAVNTLLFAITNS